MCKHVAAVLYGVGSRLDSKPEMLFLLRGVNHEELIEADAEKAVTAATSRGKSKRLATAALNEVFGIQIDTAGAGAASSGTPSEPSGGSEAPAKPAKSRAKKTTGKTEGSANAKTSKTPKKSPAGKAKKKPAAPGKTP